MMRQGLGIRFFAAVLFSVSYGLPAWADNVTFNRLKVGVQGFLDDYTTDSTQAVSGWGGALGAEYVASLMSGLAVELAAGHRRDWVSSSGSSFHLAETYYAYGARGLFYFERDEMALSLAARAFGGRLSSPDLLLEGLDQQVGYRWVELGLHHFYVASWTEGSVTLRRYFWTDTTRSNAITAELISGSRRLMWGVDGEASLNLQHVRLGASLNYAF